MRPWLRLVSLVLLALPAPLFAQTPIPIPGARPEILETSFGLAVAASGNRLAVSDAANRRVFIYTYEGGTWRVKATLTIETGGWTPSTRPGALVLDGTRLVVGMPGADEGRGAALVFDYDGTTWQQTARLIPSERSAGAQFGVSVALTAGRIVVGQTPLFANRGEQDAAFVFVRDAAAGAWTQEARLLSDIPPNADDGQRDSACFGWTVATQGDEIAVGAHCGTSVTATPRGRVYRFLRGPSGWTPGASIETPVGGATLGGVAFAGDDLIVSSSRGWHVYRPAAGGRTLATVLADTLQSHNIAYNRKLAGADSVFVGLGYGLVGREDNVVRFVRRAGTWEAVPKSAFRSDIYLYANLQVAVTAQRTIVGSAGRTFVLVREAHSAATDTLLPPDGARLFRTGTRAGMGLDLYAGHLIVGLPGSDLDAPPEYADRRGGAVVLSPTRAATAVRGPSDQRNAGLFARIGNGFFVTGNAQHYTVYRPDASVWRAAALPVSQTLQAIDARGSTLAAGRLTLDSSVGEVEIVRCAAGSACAPETVLTRTPAPGYSGERFGFSLALDRSGTGLVVGAPVFGGPVFSSEAPRVSLYARDATGAWRPEADISMPGAFSTGADPLDTFGRAVARTRDTVVVTSRSNLYVFVRTPGQTTFRTVARLSVPTPSSLTPAIAIGAGVIAYGMPSPQLGIPGQVLLFRGAATGTGWVFDRTLDGGSSGGVSFGTTLALDGTRLVVGAPRAAGGAGEVYEYNLGTSVAAEGEAAASALSLRVPNPVHGMATVRYVLDRPARVRLTVYDVLGRRVSTLVDGDRDGGTHEIAFTAGLAPGAYVVRLDADGRGATRTVVVVP